MIFILDTKMAFIVFVHDEEWILLLIIVELSVRLDILTLNSASQFDCYYQREDNRSKVQNFKSKVNSFSGVYRILVKSLGFLQV